MNKSVVIKRLAIYLLLSFGLVWVPTFVFDLSVGEYTDPLMNLIISFSMIAPAIAVLITRKVTKEGFPVVGKDALQLGISLKNKKWKWYLFAFLAPTIYSELGYLITFILFPNTYNPEIFESLGMSRWALVLVTMSGWSTAIIASIGALGEELGWRTYMYPKLEKLLGPAGSVIVGGIIWGIWHFPANNMGHNFGTDYWGEPWSGYISFTICTITMGALLYLVTKKTGSVWPATIMHAVNNASSFPLAYFFDAEKLPGILKEPPVMLLITSVPQIVMGIIATVLMCKRKKGENEQLD